METFMEWQAQMPWVAITGLIGVAGFIGGIGAWIANKLWAIATSPQADWTIEITATAEGPDTYNPDTELVTVINGTISNTGDAPAHKVQFEGPHAPRFTAGPRPPHSRWRPTNNYVAVIKPGETSEFETRLPHSTDWGGTTLTLTWVKPPTRLKRVKRQKVRLSEYSGPPKMLTVDPETGRDVWVTPTSAQRDS